MSKEETPIQRLRRVASDALDILHATDDAEAAQALEEALLDTRLGSREYECGCTVHHYVNDGGPHLHYCRVHAAAPVLRDALRAAERALSAANIAGKSLYAAEVTQAARAALALADMGKE